MRGIGEGEEQENRVIRRRLRRKEEEDKRTMMRLNGRSEGKRTNRDEAEGNKG